MISSRTAVTAVAYLGLGSVCCAVALRSWPSAGVIGVVGYALISLALLSGRSAVPWRLARVFGFWFVLVAMDTGLSKVWKSHPAALDAVIVGLMAVGLLWMAYEVWRGRVLTGNDAKYGASGHHEA